MKKSISILMLLMILLFVSCKKESAIQEKPVNNTRLLINIPNGDFELWDSGLWLSDWQTNSCPVCLPAYETYIVRQDSMPYHGLYAAKFIFNNVYASWAKNKFPVPYHPTHLTAYVKCNVISGDSVLIKIKTFHNSQVTDSGQWIGLNSINIYLPIVIPISQNSALADSALIFIRSGQKVNYPNPNTEFIVDDLILQ